MNTFFETDRLIIKFPTLADYDAIHALTTDKEVMLFIGNGSISTPEKTLAKLNKDITHFTKHQFGVGLVYEKATNQFIGQSGLTYLEYNDSQPLIELDCLLHKAYWGKGYGTELGKRRIEWGFANLPVDKLVAVVDPRNLGSQAVMLKSGMKYVNDIWCYNKTVKYYEIHR